MNADSHSLAGPYALDALPAEDRARFETHLAECPSCRADVEEFRLTGARLGAAVSESPPPALKARVMEQVHRTRQLPPPVVRLPPSLRRSRRVLLAVAAAVVLVVAAGVSVAGIRAAQEAERSRDAVTDVLAAPDSRTFHAPVRGGGTVTVVTSPRDDAAVVVLDGLRAAPTGKTHQLWLIHGTRAVSAGVVDQDGRVVRVLEKSVTGAGGFGVTIEPDGGSTTPTTPTIAEVPLTTG